MTHIYNKASWSIMAAAGQQTMTSWRPMHYRQIEGSKWCCRERRHTDSVLQCSIDQLGGTERVSSSNCRAASSGLSILTLWSQQLFNTSTNSNMIRTWRGLDNSAFVVRPLSIRLTWSTFSIADQLVNIDGLSSIFSWLGLTPKTNKTRGWVFEN